MRRFVPDSKSFVLFFENLDEKLRKEFQEFKDVFKESLLHAQACEAWMQAGRIDVAGLWIYRLVFDAASEKNRGEAQKKFSEILKLWLSKAKEQLVKSKDNPRLWVEYVEVFLSMFNFFIDTLVFSQGEAGVKYIKELKKTYKINTVEDCGFLWPAFCELSLYPDVQTFLKDSFSTMLHLWPALDSTYARDIACNFLMLSAGSDVERLQSSMRCFQRMLLKTREKILSKNLRTPVKGFKQQQALPQGRCVKLLRGEGLVFS